MINKKGSTGEMVLMIYRIILLTIIAFVILGASSIIYNYNVKTQNTEGMILGRFIIDCMTEEGIFDLTNSGDFEEDMFGYCGLDIDDDFAFVSLKFYDGEEELKKIIGGDEGLLWVGKIYSSKFKTESIKKYEPGYFNSKFPMTFVGSSGEIKGEVLLEVIINGK